MTNLDLDKLEQTAASGHAYLQRCIEGFADGYFGCAETIDASHAKHFANDLVESIEWEGETLCLVEAGVLSGVVAELREARAALALIEGMAERAVELQRENDASNGKRMSGAARGFDLIWKTATRALDGGQ